MDLQDTEEEKWKYICITRDGKYSDSFENDPYGIQIQLNMMVKFEEKK